MNYASLINRGKPDFVEIKGVTFCGGKRPQVLMENVPWHDEVSVQCYTKIPTI